MRKLLILIITVTLFTLSCGGRNGLDFDASIATQSYPIISRVDPATGTAGDTITIFGFGFSSAGELNTVVLGDNAIVAQNYALLDPPVDDEIEQIDFVIPTGLTADTVDLSLLVLENVSNPVEFEIQ